MLQALLKPAFDLFQRSTTVMSFVLVCGSITIAYLSALLLFLVATWDSSANHDTSWVLIGSIAFAASLYLQLGRAVIYHYAHAAAILGLSRVATGDLTMHFLPGWGRFEGQELWDELNRMNKGFPQIIQGIRDTAQAIETGSREVATGYADLARRTEQQSRTLEEMAALLTEVLVTVTDAAANSRQGEQVVTAVGQHVAEAVRSMRSVADTMVRIEASTRKVVEFVGIVQSISLQTNILALNAAVEAARAGEQGQGFAVVADEVRDLAHRSADATAKIKALIASSTERVAEGSALLADATRAFDAAARQVSNVTELISSVAVASAEQSGGLQSVTQALPQLETVTREGAALVSSGVAAAQVLEQTAARLVAVTRAFRLPDRRESDDNVRGSFDSLTRNLKLNRWLAVFVYLPVILSVSVPSMIGALVFGLTMLGSVAMTFVGGVSAIETVNGTVLELTSGALVVLTVSGFAVGAYLFFALAIHQVFGAGYVQRIVRKLTRGDLTWEVQVFGVEATHGHLESYGMTRALFDLKQHFTKVVREVRASATAIESTAHDIAQGYDKLAEQTQSLAAAFEEASVSVEALQATATQNSHHCQTAQIAAEEVSERAERTAHSMQRVTSTMAGIEQSAAEMKEFIGVIESIAFQTNILALNAAVEAGRAGEQGRGFAVVAAEVRTLAQRSARATEEVKGLIAESVQYVADGSTLVKEAEQTLHRVVTGVHEIVGLIGAIAKVSVEQTAGMQQISRALMQLEQGALQNAALVEEGAAAAVSFDREGAELAQSVGVFRLDKSAPKTAAPG